MGEAIKDKGTVRGSVSHTSLVRDDRDRTDEKKQKMIPIDSTSAVLQTRKEVSILACAYVCAFVISHFHVCSTADVESIGIIFSLLKVTALFTGSSDF